MNKKKILQELEPKEVFGFFEEIAAIPHGSENEKAISDYIVGLAMEKNYYVVQDEFYNVIVNIPASKGFEDRPKIIVQSHIDMVCAKKEDFGFDFEKDPIDY